ncbi:hypothetical protein GGU10DRAFT_192699 [Lentinula aff. detonsa]|uniref:Uncharacterized protein n=1 Tax=Lentinula aff. detonsa TaxID=2804958 RepID=A0AA38KQK3_9AGAR|nr:hypothetical protein GGU10DRAFT_192699 [Lentinula aff. detonsa]
MSAPSISSEALPSTPAHEWANETLNSVPSNTEDSTRVDVSAPSTATTPGLDFPGAYPKTPSTQVPLGNTSVVSSTGLPDAIANRAKQSGTIAAATVGDAANSLPHVGSLGSVGGGLDGVKEALFNATVTASQYLPPKIVEYFPGGSEIVAASNVENRFKDAQGFSLPSTEHSVDPTASSQGVGSLPGSSSEAGVAKLPLEREIDSNDNLKVQHEDLGTKESLTNASMVAQYGSSVPTPTMEKVSVDAESIPSHFKEDLDQKIPDTVTSSTAIDANIPVPNIPPITTIPIVHTASTPSTLPINSPARSSLPHSPQSKNESTIANVGHEKPFSEIPSTPSLTSNADTATTASPDSPDSPTTGSTLPKDTVISGNHTKNVSASSAFSTSSSGSAYDSEIARGHDKSISSPSGNSDSPSGTPTRKKTKLLTKIKGEAKIISGKLGGKEEKVEEGKRMLRGEIN